MLRANYNHKQSGRKLGLVRVDFYVSRSALVNSAYNLLQMDVKPTSKLIEEQLRRDLATDGSLHLNCYSKRGGEVETALNRQSFSYSNEFDDKIIESWQEANRLVSELYSEFD